MKNATQFLITGSISTMKVKTYIGIICNMILIALTCLSNANYAYAQTGCRHSEPQLSVSPGKLTVPCDDTVVALLTPGYCCWSSFNYEWSISAPEGIQWCSLYFGQYGEVWTELGTTAPPVNAYEVVFTVVDPKKAAGTINIVINETIIRQDKPPCTHQVKPIKKSIKVVKSSKNGGGGCRGCGGRDENGPPLAGKGSFALDSIDFRVDLGMSTAGEDAGYLSLNVDIPTASWSTPSILKLPYVVTNVDIVTNVAGVMEQVCSPQCLLNIVTNSAYQYRIESYYSGQFSKVGERYQTNGIPPFATYTIENPDGAITNKQLWITESRGGGTHRYEYGYDAASGIWSLTDSLSDQTLLSWIETSIGGNTNIYCEHQEIWANSVLMQKSELLYRNYSGYKALIRKKEGSGTAIRETTNSYILCTKNGRHLLERSVSNDGGWQFNLYDNYGRIATNYSGYNNSTAPSGPPDYTQTACRCTTYDYSYSSGSLNYALWSRKTVSLPIASGGSFYMQELGHIDRDMQPGYTRERTYDPMYNLLQETESSYSMGNTNLVSDRIQWQRNANGTYNVYYYGETNGVLTTAVNTGEGQFDTNGAPYILNGKQTVTVVDAVGRILSSKTYNIANQTVGMMLDAQGYNYLSSDSSGRSFVVTNMAGLLSTNYYACCGLEYSVDFEGIKTYYDYDTLRRQVGSHRMVANSPAQYIWTTNVLDVLGRVLVSKRIGSDGSEMILGRNQYDILGRVINQTNALNGVTSTTYETVDGRQRVTTVNPDGGSRVIHFFKDGRLEKLSGTAVNPVRYEYGMDSGEYGECSKQIKLNTDGTDSCEWTKTYTDMLGRSYKTEYAAESAPYPASKSFFNSSNQLVKVQDPDGVATLYQYNSKGECDYQAVDIDRDDVIDTNELDRVKWTVSDVCTNNGIQVQRMRTFVFPTNNSGTPLLISTRENSTDGRKTWQVAFGQTNFYATVYGPNAARYMTNTQPDGSYSVSTYSFGRLTSIVRKDALNSQIAATTYTYDAHGRQSAVTDARNGATTYGYNTLADLVERVTTPSPGSGQSALITLMYYDKMLRATNVVNPDGVSVWTQYHTNGLLRKTWGSRTYPVEYTYDYAGRMKTMKTWTNYAGNQGADITTWNYDSSRGWMTNKAYADSNGPSYTYTPGGKLATRTWARGIETIYNYDYAGSLTNITYSDSTPSVSKTCDRLGRIVIVNGTIGEESYTESLAYNGTGQLISESWSGGPLNSISVTNGYDQYQRRTELAVLRSSTILTLTTNSYDKASRLQSVSDNHNNVATYSYLANSPMVENIQFKNGGSVRMTTAKTFDYVNRLTGISSVNSGQSVVDSSTYELNSASQRVRNTKADGSSWAYGYDSLGQVISGKKYWRDQVPVAGQQFEYTFDDVGNRMGAKFGGDQNGVSLRSASYSVNNLNQYTSRDLPGYADIFGISISTNVVTVNGLSTYRKGEYYRNERSVENANVPVLTNLIVAATDQFSVTGNVLLAKSPEFFTYDLDGNLTSDGLWTNTWDAENRLIKMESVSSVPTAAKVKLEFSYDHRSRRLGKKVTPWISGDWSPANATVTRFIYDGWNLLAVVNSSLVPQSTYSWGTDLSGSMQGAGGVGGLLWISQVTNGTYADSHFAVFDGNGNVTALTKASDGSESARYEYGPFGELIRITGSYAKFNPFRFSTKMTDDQCGFIYYGYRFYNSSYGMWPARDSINEIGAGIIMDTQMYYNIIDESNLYKYVNNDPINSIDKLGQKCCLLTWGPKLGKGSGWGHSALSCDSTYISAWPSSGNGKMISGTSNVEWHNSQQLDEDIEGRPPDSKVCSDCIDESKVATWFASIKSSAKFNPRSSNCSDYTYQAIIAGLSQNEKPCCGPGETIINIMVPWTDSPRAVESGLKALNENGCNPYKCITIAHINPPVP